MGADRLTIQLAVIEEAHELDHQEDISPFGPPA
jgi:hypothetical protein